MKVLMSVIMVLLLWTGPGKISQINTAKSEAKKAFNDGHYKDAIKKYRYLVDSLGVNEDEVMLNLAHAYYLSNDTTNAKSAYQGLTQSAKNAIRSKALQQLGLMNNKQGKSEEALNQFKQAIKADPTNEDARYNYEMLKKKLDEKKKQDEQKNKDQKDQNKDQKNKDDQKKDENKKDQDKKNKDQQNKDQKNKDQKDQEQKDKEKKDQEQKDQQNKKDKQDKDQKDKKESQEQKDQEKKDKGEQSKEDQKKNEKQKTPPQVSEKLKEMNITEEKARMILEAMKNQEIQYLQQNKRKATKPKDKGKPDW